MYASLFLGLWIGYLYYGALDSNDLMYINPIREQHVARGTRVMLTRLSGAKNRIHAFLATRLCSCNVLTCLRVGIGQW